MFDLNTLNPQQRQAVEHDLGPLLLLAGAGSGKTRVITCRIGYLLEQRQVEAGQILALTFTNKAAREMRERVEQMVGHKASKGMVISTFHSLCVRILKAHIEKLGYKKNFSIYAASDQLRLVRDLLRELVADASSKDAERVLWQISDAKNRLVSAKGFKANINHPDSCLTAEIYPRYQKALKAFNAVDFDDLLLLVVQLFNEQPQVLADYQQRYLYQMVDEYQDTNPVQYQLLHQLSRAHGNLCVVGDDDQSIYGFRGADVATILNFEKDFPGTRVIKLEQNYRSTGHILAAANAVIGHNKKRREKALWTSDGAGEKVEYLLCEDDEDEARQVMERIHAERFKRKLEYRDFAILYRTNSQSRSFEEQLRYEDIPYVLIGGQQFFDRKEVKDLVAYLKVLINPFDEVNLLRILNYPKRGIGGTSADTLIRLSAESERPLWELLQHAIEIEGLSSKVTSAIDSFVELLKRYRKSFGHPASMVETLREMISELKLEAELYRQETDPQKARRRVENQAEVLNAMGSYLERESEPSLAGFIERVSLLDDERAGRNDKEKKLAQDAVTLMSLHASKGLEFPVVFLVGMEEETLPHKKSIYETFDIDEERRLCYVGITRARRQLVLIGARRRRRYGSLTQRDPSRFLTEIPEAVLLRLSSEVPRESSEVEKEQMASSFFAGISNLFGD
ncbi:ATP-dependent helicase [Geopsychrobacter electrodiphilus]|uniref:ATP-dependent helicase n=1 Tax=Geopsychrobacter electrodiphilus TaxID=225196 RepID=UPI0004758E7E|nr:UvrD-helicase domain-containing protein [Geopsychrobacter electrodiphilus]